MHAPLIPCRSPLPWLQALEGRLGLLRQAQAQHGDAAAAAELEAEAMRVMGGGSNAAAPAPPMFSTRGGCSSTGRKYLNKRGI